MEVIRMKNKVGKNIAVILAACVFLGIAVNSYMLAGLGSDSITVFENGLNHTFGVTMGTAAMIYNIIFLAAAVFVSRKYVGVLTALFSLLSGPFIDLVGMVMKPLAAMNAMPVRIIELAMGIIFTAMACGLLIAADGGMNSLDAIDAEIAEKTGISYKVWRTLSDIILVAAGWIMGGTVSFGTIPAVLLTGVAISFFAGWMKNAFFTERNEWTVKKVTE